MESFDEDCDRTFNSKSDYTWDESNSVNETETDESNDSEVTTDGEEMDLTDEEGSGKSESSDEEKEDEKSESSDEEKEDEKTESSDEEKEDKKSESSESDSEESNSACNGGKSLVLFESDVETENVPEIPQSKPEQVKKQEPQPQSQPQKPKFNHMEGLLYKQRIKSFVDGGWPMIKERIIPDNPHTGNRDLCTPHDLATAGLQFFREGTARCIVCHRLVTGLSPASDPWEAHKKRYPKCPIIEQGKPIKPDGYKMRVFLNFITEKFPLLAEYKLELEEEQAKAVIKSMLEEEIEAFNNYEL